jgi:hypothetical protein
LCCCHRDIVAGMKPQQAFGGDRVHVRGLSVQGVMLPCKGEGTFHEKENLQSPIKRQNHVY